MDCDCFLVDRPSALASRNGKSESKARHAPVLDKSESSTGAVSLVFTVSQCYLQQRKRVEFETEKGRIRDGKGWALRVTWEKRLASMHIQLSRHFLSLSSLSLCPPKLLENGLA